MRNQTVISSVNVTVLPADPLDEAGVLHLIRRQPGLRICPLSQARTAEVLVATAPCITSGLLQRISSLGAGRGLPVIMILDHPGNVGRLTDLLTDPDSGLRGVIWRRQFSAGNFASIVRAVSAGYTELPSEVLSRLSPDVIPLQRTMPPPVDRPSPVLDPREAQVLALVADGFENARIARTLGYSERTVKYVLTGIMTRFDLNNRSHAVAYALRSGLLR